MGKPLCQFELNNDSRKKIFFKAFYKLTTNKNRTVV